MSKDLTKELPPSDPDKLDQILTAISGLDSRLGKLEQIVEQRLYDTRPIWEKLQADIVKLQEGQAALQEGQTALQEGQAALQEGQAALQKGQAALQEGLAALREGLAALQEGQRSLVEGQEFLKREVREIRTQMRDMYRRLSIFNDTLVTMQADYRDIYDRVRELEVQRP